ncbi:probable PRM10 Pheromone-regulated protein [Rhynchosporium secalis]|uniref:Probable PRM10 Pheromone-regulated protein n=1 Tax=Rhynchosporium secalis TaxID=38038 RepID=A0A1E1LWK5_RHYSE|nr:probable PRM10 Pheromone-regulated protein [Rhynchosporium secalis]
MSSDYLTASENAPSHEYIELSSEENSQDTSANPSRPSSAGGLPTNSNRKSRVRFNSHSEANDTQNQKSIFPLRAGSIQQQSEPLPPTTPDKIKQSPAHSRNNSATSLLRRTPEIEKINPLEDPSVPIGPPLGVYKPRPSLIRNYSSFGENFEDVSEYDEKAFSALAAQERAQRVASLVGSHSAPASRRNSMEEETEEEAARPRRTRTGKYPVRIDDIPLANMDSRRTYDGAESDDDSFDRELERNKGSSSTEAHKLVRAHTRKIHSESWKTPTEQTPGLISGQVTPTDEQHEDDYVPRPTQYRGGVLSSLLKLYNAPSGQQSRRGSESSPGTGSPSQHGTGSSGMNTPRLKHAKWYNHKSQSQDTLAGLIEASAILGAQGGAATPKKTRPGMGKRSHSGRLFETAKRTIGPRPRLEDEIRITVHIAETLSRQRYLLKICRALMAYGAPTHRLEEYMKMSARVLEIDGQFLYIPGCMIISFDDISTHTTEVKLVKAPQGVDLGKLKDVHEIYKEVVHDVIGVEEATQRLDIIITNKQKNHPWLLVFVYGCASASVGPFAFQARLIDIPIAFLLGSILGFLQLIVAPRSDLYSNVFEISAAVLTSFLARAFGSIRDGNLFCFSALAQSSIALILPGYMVLCGSLELQSRSMVAGSVRMVYAIIYSLFLGFGITIGTASYGLLDSNATSQTTCSNQLGDFYKWPFVVIFTLCLCIINQAKWKQMPVMLVIAFAGYVVNFFSAKKFPSSAQISNTFGALAVGVLGNFYSRLRHGVAAAALLPAIFVQVPSGLAASGSLLAGLSTADQITNTTTYANGTVKLSGNLTSTISVTSPGDLNTIVFNVGYSMIQVAIGITVGLFLSALIVYPLGKRRSGLFSF